MASTTVTLTLKDKFSAGLNKFNSGMNRMKSSLNKVKSSFSNAQKNMGKTGSSISQINTVVGKSPSLFSRLASAVTGSKNSVSGFNSVIQKSQSVFKRFSSGLTGMLGALAGLSIFRTVSNMISSSMDTALNRLDTIDRFKQKMTLITGSSESAISSLDQLKSATKGTAYALDTSAKAVQNFVTRGMDIQSATDSTALWMDAVAMYGKGTDEEFATATDAIAKMRTKGTVEMKQLNRLFQVGINPVQIYADAVGTSAQQVQEALSSKKLKADQFITVIEDAMRNGTNGVLNVTGQAQQAGKTWAGTLNNSRIAIARGVADLVEGVQDAFTKANDGDTNYLKNYVLGIATKIENGFDTVGKNLSNDLPDILKQLKPLGTIFKEDILPPLKIGAEELYSTLKGTIIPQLIEFAETGLRILGKGLVPAIVEATRAFGGLASAVMPKLEPLVRLGAHFINNLADLINTVLIPAIQKILEVLLPVIAKVLSVLNKLTKGFNTFFTKLKTEWNDPNGVFGNLKEELKEISDKYLPRIQKRFKSAFKKLDLSGIGDHLIKSLGKLAQAVLPSGFEAGLKIFDIIARTFDEIALRVHNATIKFIDFTTAFASFVLPPAFDILVSFFDKLGRFISRIVNQNVPKLITAIDNWGVRTKAILEELGPSFGKLFGYFADNVFDGTATTFSKFIDMVIALGDAVVNHLPDIMNFFSKIVYFANQLFTSGNGAVGNFFDYITTNADRLITLFGKLIPLALGFIGAFKVYNLPFVQALKTGLLESIGLIRSLGANLSFGKAVKSEAGSSLASGANQIYSNKNDVIIANILGVISNDVSKIRQKLVGNITDKAEKVKEVLSKDKVVDKAEDLITPEETALKNKLVKEWQQKGVDYTHPRTSRIPFVDTIKEKAGNGYNAVKNGLGKAKEATGNFLNMIFEPIKNGFKNVMTFLGDGIATIKAWFLNIIPDGVIEWFIGFGETLMSWAGPLGTVATYFGIFLAVLAPIGLALTGLGVKVEQVEGFFTSLNNTISSFGSMVNNAISGFFEKITTSDWLTEFMATGAQMTVALAKGILDTALNLIDVAGQIILTFLSGLWSALPKIINAGFAFIGNLLVGIMQALPQLLDHAVQIIWGWVGMIVSKLPDIVVTGGHIIMALIEGVVQWVPKLLWEFVKMLGNLFSLVVQNLPKAVAVGCQIVWAILKGLWTLITEIPTYVHSIWDSFCTWFSNIDWKQVGLNIINGIKDGIIYAISGQWIGDLFSWMFSGFKEDSEKAKSKGEEAGTNFSDAWNSSSGNIKTPSFEDVFNTESQLADSGYNSGTAFDLGVGNGLLDNQNILTNNGNVLADGLSQNFNNSILADTQSSVDATSEYANQIGNAFDNTLTTYEPKLNAHGRQLGVSMMEQVSKGILSQKDTLTKAVSDAMSDITIPINSNPLSQNTTQGGMVKKLNSFDVGTKYVPNDMIAQIHKGEAIIPASLNPFNSSGTNPIAFSTGVEQEGYKVGDLGTTNSRQTQNNDNRNITYAPVIYCNNEEVGNVLLEDMEKFFNRQLEGDLQTMSMA